MRKKATIFKKGYGEGTWFAMPVRPSGCVVGLVARTTTRGSGILVYYFGKRFASPPPLDELAELRPDDAIKVLQAGDLGLINGEWEVIGQHPDWDRSEWPMPMFVRREPISGRIFKVEYSDKNPSIVLSEELIDEDEARGLVPNGLYGYKAAEKEISTLIRSD